MKKVQTYKIYEYNELDVANPISLTKDEGDTKGDSKSHVHALVAIYGSKSSSSSTINKKKKEKKPRLATDSRMRVHHWGKVMYMP